MTTDAESSWTPPSEAEMKVINARRDRSDKISTIMGQYLLKGYKMLATNCAVCNTILLRDKNGVDYCVSCNELDSDVSKDDPAVSREAADAKLREQSLSSGTPPISSAVLSSRTEMTPAGHISLSEHIIPPAAIDRPALLQSTQLYDVMQVVETRLGVLARRMASDIHSSDSHMRHLEEINHCLSTVKSILEIKRM